MPSSSSRSGGSGRIHPGQRSQTNHNEHRRENNYELLPEHTEAIAVTEDHEVKDATRKDYRSRLQRMVDWCLEKYPDFYEDAVYPITQQERNDASKHYYDQREDFRYDLLDSSIIRSYLSETRKNSSTGKTRSFSHVRKFYDALLFGAREQGVAFPSTFHVDLEKFLKSFKKEGVKARRAGEQDEHDSDPMSFPLYTQICTWFVQSGDTESWTFLILLWNCMGRTASVDPLGLHNIRVGTDSIIVKYDDSKMDGTGERVKPKNIYANPYNPHVCSFLSLGLYLTMYQNQFSRTDSLFIKYGKELGTGGKRYRESLERLMVQYKDEVKQWAVPGRIKAHSARKGTATYLTSGTLQCPSTSAIAQRAECDK
jgi:hypothetical protein